MSLLERLPATEATPYGPCPQSATCWAHTLNDPPDPHACPGCWQHDLGTPWAADSREAARTAALMTPAERARLDAEVHADHARMTGGTRP